MLHGMAPIDDGMSAEGAANDAQFTPSTEPAVRMLRYGLKAAGYLENRKVDLLLGARCLKKLTNSGVSTVLAAVGAVPCRRMSNEAKRKVRFLRIGSPNAAGDFIAAESGERSLIAGVHSALKNATRRQHVVLMKPGRAAVILIGAGLGRHLHLRAGIAPRSGREIIYRDLDFFDRLGVGL